MNFYDLPFDGKFIKFDAQFPHQDDRQMWVTHKVNVHEVLTADARKFIASLGIILHDWASFFVGAPHMNTSIHVDHVDTKFAINYVWGAANTQMVWYEEKPGAVAVNQLTNVGTHYTEFQPRDVVEIQRTIITGPTLVRVDIPHAVENPTANHRYCLSLRSPIPLSWDKVIKLISK